MFNRHRLSIRLVRGVLFSAKKKSNGIFKDMTNEVKERGKDWLGAEMTKLCRSLEKSMRLDFESKKAVVENISLSMSNFRGHPYIGSARIDISLPSNITPDVFLLYLQTKYSAKYKLKGTDDGVSTYNVR